MTKNIQENEGQYIVARRKGVLGSILKKNGRLSDWKSEKDRPIPPANKSAFFRRTHGAIRPEISGFKPETQAQIDSRVAALNRSESGSGRNSTPPAPPASAPTSRPAPTPPRPAPTPFGRTMSAPSAASLDKYKINKDWAAANPRLAQAQVARSSGQSRADINKILYKPGTAAYGASGQSEMEKQAKELKDTRERISKEGIKPTPVAKEEFMSKEPYDLVLEYLFSEGHVDTLDEAHYVMLQMDSNYIQSIVEGGGPLLPGEPGKAPSSGYK